MGCRPVRTQSGSGWGEVCSGGRSASLSHAALGGCWPNPEGHCACLSLVPPSPAFSLCCAFRICLLMSYLGVTCSSLCGTVVILAVLPGSRSLQGSPVPWEMPSPVASEQGGPGVLYCVVCPLFIAPSAAERLSAFECAVGAEMTSLSLSLCTHRHRNCQTEGSKIQAWTRTGNMVRAELWSAPCRAGRSLHQLPSALRVRKGGQPGGDPQKLARGLCPPTAQGADSPCLAGKGRTAPQNQHRPRASVPCLAEDRLRSVVSAPFRK